MNPQKTCAVILFLIVCAWGAVAQAPDKNAAFPNVAEVMFTVNQVEVLRFGSKTWDPAPTNAPYNVLKRGDQLRTLANSRAGISVPGQGTLILGELSYLAIPENLEGRTNFQVLKGRLFNFHRGPPGQILFQTPTVSAIVRGTEFLLSVDDDGATTINMFNGEVDMQNSSGKITLTNGQAGVARPGQPPVHTAVITTVNLIQWCLYYPAVLSLDDLPAGDLGHDLADSLVAYRSGDLIGALKAFPGGRNPVTDSEKVYYAELLLSVGNIGDAQRMLNQISPATTADHGAASAPRLGAALERLIEVVKKPASAAPLTVGETNQFCPTEWLVESYCLQSQFRLDAALIAARNAAKQAPDFGFAWERVAELEFGFGRIDAAQSALQVSLHLAPRNPEALALQGFLLAAQNRTHEAAGMFDRAIAVDGSLGVAWLGRGLCEMRLGHTSNAIKDLEVTAAVEPQRALFRSYLAKAFGTAGANGLADREIALAKQLDPGDPTAWLYSALLNQQQNQINEAVDDLQKSIDLNTNRAVFRSRLLLDQDRAVESANLASVYRDAGMTDVSVREAASAVNDDYLNASAHLFLSDAYNDLRDPTQFNLRYETVWFNELLLANLLSPVGGGRLSQTVSQQEYSKLFQQDGLGIANSTDVRSDGMYHQQSSQFGTFGNTEYALDLNYQHNNGVRVNNGLDDLEWDTTIKQQVTPRDTALFLMQYQNYHSGDNFQHYYQTNARPNYAFTEYQHPILVGGWDHEWSPGIRTLGLVGRLTDEQYFSDKAVPQTIVSGPANGPINGAFPEPYDVTYHNQFDIYSAELNQICEWDHVTLSAGARYQSGSFQAQDQFNISIPALAGLFTPTNNAIQEDFERITGYGYLMVEPLENLRLTGGFAYDAVTYPDNYRQAPLSSGQDEHSQFGPKAALVWSPSSQVTLRGVYTRSLGGVSLDESYRLEPTELAGFPQAFRSLISESIVGSVSAPSYETWGGAVDLKLGPSTFAGIQAERLTTDVQRTDGVFVQQTDGVFVENGTSAGTIPESLDYREYDVAVSLNQLLGKSFVVGTSYGITESKLLDLLPDVPVAALATANQNERSTLQQAEAYVQFNHPSGFFARAEAHWYGQSNSGWTPAEPGDDFFQENLFVGCYFAHHRGKLQVGILNLGGGNYNLNPLTPYQELPRSRVYQAGLNFIF